LLLLSHQACSALDARISQLDVQLTQLGQLGSQRSIGRWRHGAMDQRPPSGPLHPPKHPTGSPGLDGHSQTEISQLSRMTLDANPYVRRP
jgi:hypothetical protein